MVATLCALKIRLVVASLKRSVAALVLWIIGMVYLLVAIVGLLVGLVLASRAVGDHFDLVRVVLIVAGSVVVLLWAVLPPLFYGSDQTLDPSRFAQFPLSGRQLAPGLVAAGFLGGPGLGTAVVGLGTALVWLPKPAAIGPGLIGGALGATMAMVACRVVTTALSRLLASRRGRDLSGILAVLVILVGSLGFSVVANGLGSVAETGGDWLLGRLQAVSDVAVWTPFGAPWALGPDAAAGAWGLMAAHLAVSLAWLAAGLWLFGRLLGRALVTPLGQAKATKATRGDGIARATARPWVRPRAAAAWAVAARCLRYWRSDPRYLTNLPVYVILPIFGVVLTRVIMGQLDQPDLDALAGLPAWFSLPALIAGCACLFGITFAGVGLAVDVAMDSTAWWLHLTTGLRGWADRAGRVLAMSAWAIPLFTVLAVAVPVALGVPERAVGLVAASLGLFLCGMGVASVFSGLVIYPVALPGESPMAMKTGMMGAQMLGQFGALGAEMVLAAPILAAAYLVPPPYDWIVLIAALIWGGAVATGGIIWGGRILDARGAKVLATLRRNDTRA